jgi:hypothetical protein
MALPLTPSPLNVATPETATDIITGTGIAHWHHYI